MSSLLLLAVLTVQDPPGIVLERKVRLSLHDPVDRVREIHREERVKLLDGRLSVEDLTFGTRLIVRADRKLVWMADPLSGTYSELSFDGIAKLRAGRIAEIAGARRRVAGSGDEEKLANLLKGLGEFDAAPKVEVRATEKRESVAGRNGTGRLVVIDGDIHYFDVVVDPDLADALPYFDLLAQIGAYPAAVAQALKGLGGFPLKGTVRYSLFLDRVRSEEEVTAVRREAVPAADFELPAGLRKVPLKGFEPEEAKKPEKPKDFVRSFREDELDREQNPLREPDKKERPK